MEFLVTSMLVAIQVRKLRQAQNMTQEALALGCRWHPTQVSRFESGHLSITVDQLSRIARVLGVKVSKLIEQVEAEDLK